MTERCLMVRLLIAVIVAALLGSLFACTQQERNAGPPEKVTIAFSATTESVLAEVALVKGFFREEGLEVTPRLHPYGRRALEDMLAGNADFATVAETPVMFAIMRGEKIAVIATIESSNRGNAIIASRDRGILAFNDLRGKRIAATLGTVSEFFIDAIMTINGISRSDIEVVDMKAEEIPDALAGGEIDAASTFNPYTAIIQKNLGNRVVAFQDKDIYRWTFNVVARQEFIGRNPDKVKKVLRALVRAEEFVRKNPAEAQKIVARFSRVDPAIVRDIWADTNFAVTLDQLLILALEDEARWAIEHGLTSSSRVPNFLEFIYFDGLGSVKPAAVSILK